MQSTIPTQKDQMMSALKIIHTWAVFDYEHGSNDPYKTLKLIANQAARALGRDDLIEK